MFDSLPSRCRSFVSSSSSSLLNIWASKISDRNKPIKFEFFFHSRRSRLSGHQVQGTRERILSRYSVGNNAEFMRCHLLVKSVDITSNNNNIKRNMTCTEFKIISKSFEYVGINCFFFFSFFSLVSCVHTKAVNEINWNLFLIPSVSLTCLVYLFFSR